MVASASGRQAEDTVAGGIEELVEEPSRRFVTGLAILKDVGGDSSGYNKKQGCR